MQANFQIEMVSWQQAEQDLRAIRTPVFIKEKQSRLILNGTKLTKLQYICWRRKIMSRLHVCALLIITK